MICNNEFNYTYLHTSENLFCSNSYPMFELSVKFASHIYHKNINKPIDGAYLADFVIDISGQIAGSIRAHARIWYSNGCVLLIIYKVSKGRGCITKQTRPIVVCFWVVGKTAFFN